MAKTREQPNRPEGLALNKDGTASVTFDAQVWRLRRPKVGEFKRLRAAVHEVQDRSLEIEEKARDEAVAMLDDAKSILKTGESEDDLDQAEKSRRLHQRTLEGRRQTRERTEQLDELHADWVCEAFDMLADHPLPATWEVRDAKGDVVGGEHETRKEAEAAATKNQTVHRNIDDWPNWLREPDVIQKLIEHFRTVPLAPGAGG